MPSKPGVYLFLDKKNRILYVGKAKNLKKRVSSYFLNTKNLLEKTKILVSQIKKIRAVTAESEIQALLLEANYIKLYKPKYNAKLTDDKAYPFICITYSDEYPKVLIVRRSEDKNSLYFGPFPNASAMRLVLRTIRRIFPFQSVINHPKKLCLYYHLGLCPCPGVSLTKDTPYQRSILVKEYRKNIKHIITFLKGDTKKVLKNLANERNLLSKEENFEKARILQRKIDSILYITSPAFEKFDHKINPNLDEDLRYKELLELKKCLLSNNVSIKSLGRIECFDISNISGTNATGSMVVFINGEKDTSQYRKFRIRNLPNFPNLPNDFAMMQQIISRRLNHPEWLTPDLIIVDGGKGQVSAAMEALYSSSEGVPSGTPESRSVSSRPASPAGGQVRTISAIPVIGLAKKEETIILPLTRHSGKRGTSASRISSTNQFIEISLPKDSPALQLIMRIRDEAHRFAISYHRKLRSKSLTN